MSAWIIPPVAGLIEPAVAPEFFVTHLGAIERYGANLRFYLTARQRAVDDPAGAAQQVVVAKIVGPILGLPRIVAQIAQCLSDEAVTGGAPEPTPTGPWPRLVR